MLSIEVLQVEAHEKWLHKTENYNFRQDLLLRSLSLAFIAAVLLAAISAWFYRCIRHVVWSSESANLRFWRAGLRKELLAILSRDDHKQTHSAKA